MLPSDLSMDMGIGPDTSLPVTLITAIILQSVWKEREAKTSVRPHSVRADLEQYINLLKKTRQNIRLYV